MTSARWKRPAWVVTVAVAGVVGGWLAIMTPAVITLALRLRDLGASRTAYAVVLGAGWLTVIIALVAFGSLSDRLRVRAGSRAGLARIGVPLLVVFGVLLALAPNPLVLAVVWVLAQLPAAMVVTTALATSGELIPERARRLTSGLVGAAPILSVLVGSALVGVVHADLGLALVLPAVLGALLAAPLMGLPASPGAVGGPGDTTADARMLELGLRSAPWALFLAGSFLLSWTTSTANGFIVVFVDEATTIAESSVGPVTAGALVVASAVAAGASIAAGALASTLRMALAFWAAGALACAFASGWLLIAAGTPALMFVGLFFGVGFGVVNGVELTTVLRMRPGREHLARDLGVLNATTSAPYVLVPALAGVVLAGDAEQGVRLLFLLAAALAVVASVLVAALALRARRLV